MADICDEEALHVVQLQTMAVMCHLQDQKSPRAYMRPIFARRQQQGDLYHLVRELALSDTEYFRRYVRFSPALLEEVLQLVGPIIQHGRTHRIPIGPKERLMITIRSVVGFLERKEMNFPQPANLPNTQMILPHVLVGDEAFPMREDLMRSYHGRNLTEDKKIFNYLLSRARRVIENTFGILVARWRIFRGPIISKPENVVAVVKATICLHNFLRRSDIGRQPTERYCPPGFTDYDNGHGNIIEGAWRCEILERAAFQPIGRIGTNNHGVGTASVRQDFNNYFNSDAGALPWQLRHVRRGQEPDSDNSDN